VSPALGVWLDDIVFLLGGALLLWRAERKPFEISSLPIWNPFKSGWKEGGTLLLPGRTEDAFERASSRKRVFSARFPMILDDYVIRDFLLYLAMIVSAFLMLLLVFTLFELLGDILRNQISPLVVAAYLLNVAPYF